MIEGGAAVGLVVPYYEFRNVLRVGSQDANPEPSTGPIGQYCIRLPADPFLLCDDEQGFRPPEMVKRRPVVVLSHRLRHRDGLCTVVPLSTTPPRHPVLYVCHIAMPGRLPPPFTAETAWVKDDMLTTVSFRRLDLFRTPRDATGVGTICTFALARALGVKYHEFRARSSGG